MVHQGPWYSYHWTGILTHFIAFHFTDLCLFKHCYTTLVEDLEIDNIECLKYSLSKGLGLGIVVGGSIMKVPQLILSAPPFITILSYAHSFQFLVSCSYLRKLSAWTVFTRLRA